MTNQDLAKFRGAFIEAMYFTDTGEGDQPASDADLSDEAFNDISADCHSFWRRFGCYITTEVCAEAFDDPVSRAGYDFHMTRNGHGVGFWEGEWPQPYRDMLTKAAEGYGPLEVYKGDDGLIYV